jgi:hypothetical protein
MRSEDESSEPVELDFGPHRLQVCPECGASGLEPVTDGYGWQFFCGACRCCWHLELGSVYRVNPATCPGCRHRPECLAAPRPYGGAARRGEQP